VIIRHSRLYHNISENKLSLVAIESKRIRVTSLPRGSSEAEVDLFIARVRIFSLLEPIATIYRQSVVCIGSREIRG
jgi:hypothetical protein